MAVLLAAWLAAGAALQAHQDWQHLQPAWQQAADPESGILAPTGGGHGAPAAPAWPLGYAHAQAQDRPFVTTWETTSSNETITIPGTGMYTINWGDDSDPEVVTNEATHTYASAGNYTVSITGDLGKFDLATTARTNAQKLQSIDQWGDIEWTSMNGAFDSASAMVYNATDEPDLSRVTSMSSMFYDAAAFNGDISGWDVSKVTHMSSMFYGAAAFNGDISGWNVSQVTSMLNMFYGAAAFNQNISGWDVSQVAYMDDMFSGATSFDQNLGNWYVVPADTDYDTSDVSLNVTTISAQNHILDGHTPEYGIGSGDDSDLFNMTESTLMFKAAPPVGNHTANVTASGGSVFKDGNYWRELVIRVAGGDPPVDTTSPVITLAGANPLTISVGTAYMSPGRTCTDATDDDKDLIIHVNVTALDVHTPGTYTVTYTCTDPAGNVGTATREVKVVDASAAFVTTWRTDSPSESITFPGTGTYTINWGDGTTPAEVEGPQTHQYATAGNHTVSITGGLERFNLNNDQDNAPKLQSIDQWGDIEWTSNMRGAFWGAANMVYKATDAPDLSGVRTTANMFYGASSFEGDISEWDVSQVENMNSMFYSASSFDGDISEWNVSQVTDMGGMFIGARSFNQTLNGWDVLQVENMNSMFSTAAAFNRPLNGWNVSSVTDMNHMFISAPSFNQDLSSWNVSQVETMRDMFSGATSFDGNVSSWDVSQVEDMNAMFRATAFDGDISSWNVSNVEDMGNMFTAARFFNQDISGWDVSQVTNMDSMFTAAFSFQQNLGNWYVVPADTAYDTSEGTLNVTTISAQNSFLDDHSHTYGIGSGGDSALFNMTESTLMFEDTPSAQNYTVTVTAPGGDFGTGNSRTLTVTVTADTDTTRPNITISGENPYTHTAGTAYDDPGATCEDDTDGILNATSNATAINADTPAGNHTVTYTCTDSSGNVATADRTVTVVDPEPPEGNRPPVVSAGPDQTVGEGETVTLSGSATDPDDDAIVSYLWSAPSGSGITFANASSPSTTFTAPAVEGDATFTLTLTASDGTENGSDDVDVTVKETGSAFITTWRAASSDRSITITGTGAYTIDWGDGTAENATGARTHEYASAGTYTVSITGGLESFRPGDTVGNAEKLRSIEHWGAIKWDTMEKSFQHASKMKYRATDAPDLSGVEDMSLMFAGASKFNGNISGWNVSQVETMASMFREASDFDQDLNGWDVSQVDDMSYMFFLASDFDQDLNGWDVSQVTDMSFMFSSASDFDGDISGWDVSRVETMDSMFHGASDFDGDISGWNVSRVETMRSMFLGASDFDQNLGKWYVVPADTAYASEGALNVTTISAQNSFLDGHDPEYGIGPGGDSALFNITDSNTLMFKAAPSAGDRTVNVTASGADVFEGENNWRVLRIAVDGGTGAENGPPVVNAGEDQTVWEGEIVALSGVAGDPDAGDAIVSYLWSAQGSGITFDDASSASTTFTAPAVEVDTAFTLTLTAGDGKADGSDDVVVTVKETGSAFITTWKTTEDDEGITIPGTGAYTIDWGDGTAEDAAGPLPHQYATAGNHTVRITGGLESIRPGDSPQNAEKLQSIEHWGAIEWDTMAYSFQHASDMEYRATDAPDLSGVADMTGMFSDASDFDGDISGWDVSQVTGMSRMFYGASSFNQPLSGWDVSSVQNMQLMFFSASSFNQPLSGWDVSSVQNMQLMFFSASSFNQDLSGWAVSGVTDMSFMFSGASSFDGDISEWDVSKVETMDSMFRGASSFNQDVSSWDVSKVETMDSMFRGASDFDQNLGKWYVVPADTAYDSEDALNVTTISAQNSFLGGQSPKYGLGTGGDSALFNITDSNTLMFEDTPTARDYRVNVTASGADVFEGENNWRVLRIAVDGGTGAENGPPVVNAGEDQTVGEGETVTLSGSATDPDDDAIVSYLWSAPGSGIEFAEASSASTTFTAPAVEVDTAFTLTLTAGDGTDYGSDDVVVTVRDSASNAPTADAGPDQTVNEGDAVTLDGSGSSDPNNDALEYFWEYVTGQPPLALSGAAAERATFAAPHVEQATDLEFRLTVRDTDGNEGTDTVTVKIRNGENGPPADPPNRPPRVDARGPASVVEGDTATLAGMAADPDGDRLEYLWTQTSPASPRVALDSPRSLATAFTAPQVDSDTTFTFALTASDGRAVASDSVSVKVTDRERTPAREGGSTQRGSGGGGGGGGGGGAPAEIITDVRIYSVSWDCMARAVSATVGPDTDQLTVRMRTSSAGEIPVSESAPALPGSRTFAAVMSAADDFVVVEANLAYEGGQVITKIVNFRECTGSVTIDRYEPPEPAPARPQTEPAPAQPRTEPCGDGREPAVRDGSRLLCLFPGTFEILAERGWNLARP